MGLPETCKMKSRIKVDRISVLPKNIINSVLTRLEIKEAVRTSILSRSWRYQWHFLSKININCHDLQVSEMECVNIIDHILLVHCGSVESFRLTINFQTYNDIDRWILYVSRNGMKELILWCIPEHYNHYNHYNLPSSLFSCSDLEYLELHKCIFKPPPAAFKTFSNLTELSFHNVIITNKVLENVVNSCPLLSILTLENVEPPPSLKINTPKLVRFRILNFNGYPQFMNTPLLNSASFVLENRLASVNEDFKMVNLLGSMPFLQRLEFEEYALRHLAVVDVPTRLPLTCPIKHLTLHINFEDLQELRAVFCMFRSFPYIQHLELGVIYDDSRISADGFWKEEQDFSFRFDYLQIIKVIWFTGTESELKFVEFLLSNAPVLKTMNIDFDQVDDVFERELTIVKKLIRFPRISPKAELILH